jgi:hypothetical protein
MRTQVPNGAQAESAVAGGEKSVHIPDWFRPLGIGKKHPALARNQGGKPGEADKFIRQA